MGALDSSRVPDLVVSHLSAGARSFPEFGAFGSLELSEGHLALRGPARSRAVLEEEAVLFEDSPRRAVAIHLTDAPWRVLLAGEESDSLFQLDLHRPQITRLAHLDRFPNDVGGMRRLEIIPTGPVALLHWEIGLIALGSDLSLRWRRELPWNHAITRITEQGIWLDLMYESEEAAERIGEAPWGFALDDGRPLEQPGG